MVVAVHTQSLKSCKGDAPNHSKRLCTQHYCSLSETHSSSHLRFGAPVFHVGTLRYHIHARFYFKSCHDTIDAQYGSHLLVVYIFYFFTNIGATICIDTLRRHGRHN